LETGLLLGPPQAVAAFESKRRFEGSPRLTRPPPFHAPQAVVLATGTEQEIATYRVRQEDGKAAVNKVNKAFWVRIGGWAQRPTAAASATPFHPPPRHPKGCGELWAAACLLVIVGLPVTRFCARPVPQRLQPQDPVASGPSPAYGHTPSMSAGSGTMPMPKAYNGTPPMAMPKQLNGGGMLPTTGSLPLPFDAAALVRRVSQPGAPQSIAPGSVPAPPGYPPQRMGNRSSSFSAGGALQGGPAPMYPPNMAAGLAAAAASLAAGPASLAMSQSAADFESQYLTLAYQMQQQQQAAEQQYRGLLQAAVVPDYGLGSGSPPSAYPDHAQLQQLLSGLYLA
jgi:hypothetical protein